MSAPEKKGKFEPKTPVNLKPPKSDPITVDHLSKCNGKSSFVLCYRGLTIIGTNGYPCYVAIKVCHSRSRIYYQTMNILGPNL